MNRTHLLRITSSLTALLGLVLIISPAWVRALPPLAFSPLNSYEETEEGMESQVLEVSQPKDSLVGTWQGYYLQGGKQYPFTLSLESATAGRISGSIVEPRMDWGPTDVTMMTSVFEGSYDPATGDFSFTKRYTTKGDNHTVGYSGMRLNSCGVSGRWDIGGAGDEFHMTRLHR